MWGVPSLSINVFLDLIHDLWWRSLDLCNVVCSMCNLQVSVTNACSCCSQIWNTCCSLTGGIFLFKCAVRRWSDLHFFLYFEISFHDTDIEFFALLISLGARFYCGLVFSEAWKTCHKLLLKLSKIEKENKNPSCAAAAADCLEPLNWEFFAVWGLMVFHFHFLVSLWLAVGVFCPWIQHDLSFSRGYTTRWMNFLFICESNSYWGFCCGFIRLSGLMSQWLLHDTHFPSNLTACLFKLESRTFS